MPVIHDTSTATPKPEIARALVEFDPTAQGYVADTVARPIGVLKKEGSLRMIMREDFGRIEDVDVAPGATYPRGNYRTDLIQYATTKRGHEEQVTDEDYAQYRTAFDAEEMAARRCEGVIVLKREKDVADALFDTSTWTGSDLYTDNSGSPWSTTSTNVIDQIDTAVGKVLTNTGVQPNALIAPRTAMNELLMNDDIIGRFPGATRVTRQMLLDNLASIFDGIDTIVEPRTYYNSANEGQTWSGSSIWDGAYVMVAKIATTNDPAEPCVMRQIRWTDVMGADVPHEVRTYPEPQTDSNVVQVRSYRQVKVIDEYFAHLMKI